MANLMYSTNGVTWITSTTVHVPDAGGSTLFSRNLEANNIKSVAYSNNIGGWVAAGDNGLIYKQASNTNLNNVNIAYQKIGIDWTTQDPRYLVSGLNINSISYGNGFWAAGLDTGYIHNSTDAISWSPQTGNMGARDVWAISYGNGAFVAAGAFGLMSFSTNTVNWTTMPATGGFGSTAIRGITYGNNLWVAVGDAGQLRSATTTNNVSWTWTTRTTNTGTKTINSIAYGNGAFVAVGNNTGTTQTILRSDATAVTWTTINAPMNGTLYSVAYGNGVFVAGGINGALGVSTDGTTWISKSTPFSPSTARVLSIVYTGSAWLFCTSTVGNFYYSTDLITWTTTSLGAVDTNTMSYGNDIVAVGGTTNSQAIFTSKNSAALNASSIYSHNNDILSISSDKKVYNSKDMISYNAINLTWTTQNSLNFNNGNIYFNISYGNGLWFAGGEAGMARKSTDTITWTTINANFGNSIMYCSLYTNPYWLIGGGGTRGGSGPLLTIFNSDFTSILTYTSTTLSIGNNSISGIAYGQGKWVIVASAGKISYSLDTSTWTTATATFGVSDIYSIAYGNSVFVASAINGRMSKSTDGISWATITPTVSTFPTTININSVVYGSGIWVAAGNSNSIRTSTDLLTWATRTGTFVGPYTASTNHILSVSYGNGFWMASNDAGRISVSSDGISWVTQSTTLGYTALNAVAYGNGIFGIVSAWSTISQSIPATVYMSKADVLKNNPTTPINSYYSNPAKNINVLVGNSGYIYTSDSTYDPNAFYPINTGINDDFYKITWSTNTATSGGIWEMIGGYSQYTSTNLITWTTVSNFPSYSKVVNLSRSDLTSTKIATGSMVSNTLAIAYGNGLWAALGDASYAKTSTDTITWVSTNMNFGQTRIRGIAYGNGTWVAVGYGTGVTPVFRSTNGTAWTTLSNPPSGTQFICVEYGNGKFVAGQPQSLSSSTNGIDWVLPSNNIFSYSIVYGLGYGNGNWVAAASNGLLGLSTDALSWTTINSNFGTSTIMSVFYGNNLWMATGFNSQIRVSTDFITWITRDAGFSSTSILYKTIYSGGFWMVGSDSNGLTKKSTDTINWTTLTKSSTFTAISIAYGNGIFLSASDNGYIDKIQFNYKYYYNGPNDIISS
jgi:hypothetical protein